MKAVVFYDASPRVMELAPLHFPAHQAHMARFAAELIGIGPFGSPTEGSMAIFRSREAAEAFVKDDPFVTEGVVAKVTIRDWRDEPLK